jgi:hypothetical protein
VEFDKMLDEGEEFKDTIIFYQAKIDYPAKQFY